MSFWYGWSHYFKCTQYIHTCTHTCTRACTHVQTHTHMYNCSYILQETFNGFSDSFSSLSWSVEAFVTFQFITELQFTGSSQITLYTHTQSLVRWHYTTLQHTMSHCSIHICMSQCTTPTEDLSVIIFNFCDYILTSLSSVYITESNCMCKL